MTTVESTDTGKITVANVVASPANVTTENTRELRGGGGARYGPTISCGYCDTACVYSSIESVFVLGVLANILVIYRVAKDKHLHDSTFTAIAALAVADTLFLALNLTTSFESVILTVTCSKPVIISQPYYILRSIFWFAANSHLALLAVLRYVIMAYPLKSNAYLSVRRVIGFSIGVWILGGILMGSLTAVIVAGLVLPGKSQEFIIILWVTVYLLPLIIMCILHLVKLFLVRKATQESATDATRKSIRRMSRIVISVIVMAAVLPLPRLINSCLKVAGKDQFPSAEFKTHFAGISDLLFLVNHFINPFIYGFLSQKFRQSVRRMFNCEVSDSDDSNDTAETPLSVRRNNFNMAAYNRKKSSFDSLGSFDKM